MNVCTVEGCEKRVYSKGKCQKHYRQEQRISTPRKCSVEGCDSPHIANGFCRKHYQEFKAHGEIRGKKERCCEVCGKVEYAKGLCKNHYMRKRRTGTTETIRKINTRECKGCGETKKIHGNDLCRRCYKQQEHVRFARAVAENNRRVKLKSSYKKYTKQDVINKSGGLCGICGKEIDLTLKRPDMNSFSIDHIVPISKGGSNSLDNVQAAHLLCNCLKQASYTKE